MMVAVQLYASAREAAGAAALTLELPAHSRLADLRRELARAHPRLVDLLPRCALAVDNEFAADDLTLAPGAVVAVLPPVGGG
ncbi:MAG TPA: MoaD/ThiS family protein [Gemmatales bacterium]|nr:MoaD/ThiS family protein [Gemmatales bacterium]HMP59633.1 MoaD/ThiS family protein [Gemmatales bacterium]